MEFELFLILIMIRANVFKNGNSLISKLFFYFSFITLNKETFKWKTFLIICGKLFTSLQNHLVCYLAQMYRADLDDLVELIVIYLIKASSGTFLKSYQYLMAV
jgi:hypothetical protein